jgi:hypothetical protein
VEPGLAGDGVVFRMKKAGFFVKVVRGFLVL